MKTTLVLFFISIFSYNSVLSQDFLTFKKHIPSEWIANFDFFNDGILLAEIDSSNLKYHKIDENLDLTHQYSIYKAGSNFYLNGSYLHSAIIDQLYTFQLEDDSYTQLTPSNFNAIYNRHHSPITYFNENIYFSRNIGSTVNRTEYYRFDVSDPNNTIQTGKTRTAASDSDLCYSLIADDDFIYASRQLGVGASNNFRIIDNSLNDTLISTGIYGNTSSYTADMKKHENLLILAHVNGLRVYDISDIDNMTLAYSYATDWGRCLEMIDNYIIMGTNAGWDVFEISENNQINHLQTINNDSRVWKLKYKEETNELWSSVDGGDLGGLVVFDVFDFSSSTEDNYYENIQVFPNPTNGILNIDFANGNIQKLKITDLTGKQVLEKVNLRQDETVDLSDLETGVYIVSIQIEDAVFTSKIIKR